MQISSKMIDLCLTTKFIKHSRFTSVFKIIRCPKKNLLWDTGTFFGGNTRHFSHSFPFFPSIPLFLSLSRSSITGNSFLNLLRDALCGVSLAGRAQLVSAVEMAGVVDRKSAKEKNTTSAHSQHGRKVQWPVTAYCV